MDMLSKMIHLIDKSFTHHFYPVRDIQWIRLSEHDNGNDSTRVKIKGIFEPIQLMNFTELTSLHKDFDEAMKILVIRKEDID